MPRLRFLLRKIALLSHSVLNHNIMLRLHSLPPPELSLIATTATMWLDLNCVISGAVAVNGITKFLQLKAWTLKAWRPTNFFMLSFLTIRLLTLNTNDDEAAVFLSENSGICIYSGPWYMYTVSAMHVAYIYNIHRRSKSWTQQINSTFLMCL